MPCIWCQHVCCHTHLKMPQLLQDLWWVRNTSCPVCTTNHCGWCWPGGGAGARGNTWGEQNWLICVIRPDNLGCILQGAIWLDSIPKLRCKRRHCVGVRWVASEWYLSGCWLLSERGIPYLCTSQLLSSIWQMVNNDSHNKGNSLND